MPNSKKLLQAAAGAAGGAGLDVDEVFSTYLYDGNTSTQTITNDIDLSGEGGLVWIKCRTSANNPYLYDTERGVTKQIAPNSTAAEVTDIDTVTAFNSNGFTLGDDAELNTSNEDYVSWTWRKAPKFFDVVTYTGDGVAGRTVSHNLGSVPGMIIVKETSSATNWAVYHRSIGASNTLWLDLTNASSASSNWNSTAPTDSVFTVGSAGHMNGNGDTYVAYLFAHNDGDGEFGPDSDQDIIKCGSYTGVSATEISVDLGFEPQWVMIKRATGTNLAVYASWFMQDTMRGMVAKGADAKDNVLYANQSQAEGFRGNGGATDVAIQIHPNATGFTVPSTNSIEVNEAGETYIYMAIRRGPLAPPESATDVFAIDEADSSSPPYYRSSFPVDFAIKRVANSTSSWFTGTRLLQGKYLLTDSTAAEVSASAWKFDFMNGWRNASGTTASDYSWMWKRAPEYFDVVAYTGNGTAGHTVTHNLGVAPEMMWVKQRDVSRNWTCYFETLGTGVVIKLNDSTLAQSKTQRFDTAPTDSVFYLGSDTDVNSSGGDYIAYLFASLDGVSKVGSYTGDGTNSKTIDCGFTSGARFVMIKRTSGTGSWITYDTERGITVSDDPFLYLDTTAAENTISSFDIDPNSSGFTLGGSGSYINASGETYIFYAIA